MSSFNLYRSLRTSSSLERWPDKKQQLLQGEGKGAVKEKGLPVSPPSAPHGLTSDDEDDEDVSVLAPHC